MLDLITQQILKKQLVARLRLNLINHQPALIAPADDPIAAAPIVPVNAPMAAAPADVIINPDELPNCFCGQKYVSEEIDGPMVQCANSIDGFISNALGKKQIGKVRMYGIVLDVKTYK